FWRNFENLPKFMAHLESVKTTDGNKSHWVAKAPMGTTVEWDAEITSEQENERIGWKSLEGADIPNSGVVEFKPTTNRGTEVKVTLTYEAPGGALGAMFAKLFGEEPSQQVYGDLYRFKSLMESGEVITVEGQSSGREPQAKKATA
ncbi:MAG TPA: SRPBCC family protein, partial [Pyrinomonadaceae bacterium]|nr:SRPBCC family protein [Pyrinomonadaceae bacterium]